MTRKQTAGGVVVVGVDGSEASKDALRWAMRYARKVIISASPATRSSPAT